MQEEAFSYNCGGERRTQVETPVELMSDPHHDVDGDTATPQRFVSGSFEEPYPNACVEVLPSGRPEASSMGTTASVGVVVRLEEEDGAQQN